MDELMRGRVYGADTTIPPPTVTSTTIDPVRPRAKPSSTNGERQLRDHSALVVVDAGLDGVVKGRRPT
ncbi:hypothetical protein [Streptomyces sp. NPDC101393]|uniref:hypothetical protein n=1 Tax=Streptomyces sp. NPDC101393 TaxID=3366141 RepID=UPI0038271C0F